MIRLIIWFGNSAAKTAWSEMLWPCFNSFMTVAASRLAPYMKFTITMGTYFSVPMLSVVML